MVVAPIKSPLDFDFAPAAIPPIKMVIKATIFVTKLNDSSVNCVNDKIVAAIRLNTTAGTIEMNTIPKFIITIGVVLIVVGILWQLFGRFIQLGKLPGDIVIKGENTSFYFPVVT